MNCMLISRHKLYRIIFPWANFRAVIHNGFDPNVMEKKRELNNICRNCNNHHQSLIMNNADMNTTFYYY